VSGYGGCGEYAATIFSIKVRTSRKGLGYKGKDWKKVVMRPKYRGSRK
jgi:hypothetical protein